MPVSRNRKKQKKKISIPMAGPLQQKNDPENSGKLITQQRRVSYYQGAIPPADMMQHYGEIDSSFPSRILSMAEEEGKDRRKKESRIISLGFILDLIGVISALLAVGGVIGLCYYFLIKGAATQGATIATSVIVAIAIAFLSRGRNKNSNTENK
jgi:uncharacterized membrane protein